MSAEQLAVARALAALDADQHPGPDALLDSLRLVLADRDRLATELASMKDGRAVELDKAYNEGWREGCGGYESLGDMFSGADDS